MVKKTTKTMPLSVDEIDTMYRSMLKVEDGDSILKSIGKVPPFDAERVLSKRSENVKTPRNFNANTTGNNFKTPNANFKNSNANFKNANANFKNTNANFKNTNANFKPANNFKTPISNADFKSSNNFKTPNFSLDKKPWWKFW